jgi:hypothetical protein
VERFAAVYEAAGERGLQACLEFMIFSSVKTIAGAERVLNRAGHPAGAVLVDALHLQRSGGTPADVSAVAPERLPYAGRGVAGNRGASCGPGGKDDRRTDSFGPYDPYRAAG